MCLHNFIKLANWSHKHVVFCNGSENMFDLLDSMKKKSKKGGASKPDHKCGFRYSLGFQKGWFSVKERESNWILSVQKKYWSHSLLLSFV